MSLKRGGGPRTIPVTLTIKGQGSVDKLDVVYHNKKSSEVKEQLAGGLTLAATVPLIVESWNTDFELTAEGVEAFEDEYPGITVAIIEGFWKARRKESEGN